MDKKREQLNNAIEYAMENLSFNKLNLVERAENICVFGLGTYFKEAFVSQEIKEKYRVNLLSDNDPDKWGKTFEGIECICPEQLKEYSNLVVIIMMGNTASVVRQLTGMGIICVSHADLSLDVIMEMPTDLKWFKGESEKIRLAYELFSDDDSRRVYVEGLCNRIAPALSTAWWDDLYSKGKQYFNGKYLKLNNQEVYVDCGAYTGDTVNSFCNAVDGYKKIFAFEMDGNNFRSMQDNIGYARENMVLYNYGVWNENTELDYGIGTSENEPLGGISVYKTERLPHNVIQKAKLCYLDDILSDEEVTFIKMDIEGSEINALRGAEKIIRTQKPKLAICVYHKTSDFWQVPLLLKEYNSEYRFALMHHHPHELQETVLYAY